MELQWQVVGWMSVDCRKQRINAEIRPGRRQYIWTGYSYVAVASICLDADNAALFIGCWPADTDLKTGISLPFRSSSTAMFLAPVGKRLPGINVTSQDS